MDNGIYSKGAETMNLSKAIMKCPVCGTENETRKIEVSQEIGIFENTTIIRVRFYCPECGTRHSEDINTQKAHQKLGDDFMKIIEDEGSEKE